MTFEYALIHGENDSNADMDNLCRLLRGMLCHVNLIPLNQVEETGFKNLKAGIGPRSAWTAWRAGAYQPPSRRQLGADIDGACG